MLERRGTQWERKFVTPEPDSVKRCRELRREFGPRDCELNGEL